MVPVGAQPWTDAGRSARRIPSTALPASRDHGLGALLGGAQQGHGSRTLRYRQVGRLIGRIRPQRLEPESSESAEKSPVAVAGDGDMVRLGQADYLSTSIRWSLFQ